MDFPELLLEVAELTGLPDAFTRISGAMPTMDDFATSLCAVWLDTGYRCMIGAQLNVTEARHRLARRIFFGQLGELRQHYRQGMQDQLGALGLALNAVVLFNTLYIDTAVKRLAADGFPVTDDRLARLSPIQFGPSNFLGRYAFPAPRSPAHARWATRTPPRRTSRRSEPAAGHSTSSIRESCSFDSRHRAGRSAAHEADSQA
ncbi:Tn3 family transposase [Streptomyces sp. JV185]|uniref:Tn3 family transposase n=1 Tax=Streptomyces sp. JV185 TaxID=858638 RepID=UPI002E786162|nr:Tn3 family transposase [Streptomyces sp. JV185]MEE1768345.1 Tn3 family transposase [Streptomyces sp. JV185]